MIAIKYSHSVLLKIALAVTLVWRFKKNRQTTKLKSPPNVLLIRYCAGDITILKNPFNINYHDTLTHADTDTQLIKCTVQTSKVHRVVEKF